MMMMTSVFLTLVLLLCTQLLYCGGELSSGRIKADDEPRIVSWRVLEGITEPFDTSHDSIPAWKQMKNLADQKAASMAIQQALHEYGQILRHPYLFGEMPSEEKYDIFLSMAKLLKMMGFHQRAEILLYESMVYAKNTFEAHFQLALLFVEKEDVANAKLHLKNCLFYQETDLTILVYLSTLLLVEGKVQEAKFFISRVLSHLEKKVIHGHPDMELTLEQIRNKAMDYKVMTYWLEDLMVKVLHGEYRIAPSASLDLYAYMTSLYHWISSGEMTGRFVFDLGQSLYEGGKAKIGHNMMLRGFETSNPEEEGIVSQEVVRLRLAMEQPTVPESITEVIEAYLNTTSFLSLTADNFSSIDILNVMDLFWPIPLQTWSALPVMPVQQELYWRFVNVPVRKDDWALPWLEPYRHSEILTHYLKWKALFAVDPKLQALSKQHSKLHPDSTATTDQPNQNKQQQSGKGADNELERIGRYEDLLAKADGDHRNRIVVPPMMGLTLPRESLKVEVGIFGGHMNNHPVGHATLRRILALFEHALGGSTSATTWRKKISFTLLSTPLVPDSTTKRIASKVDKIVNIPMDLNHAMTVIQSLKLDVVLFPDWQPFPDQQSVIYQSIRMAPVQICFYVRGSSCASTAVDYYLLPQELGAFYTQAVPASAIDAKRELKLPPTHPHYNSTKKLFRNIRPAWRESYLEQVVLVDWPIITAADIEQSIAHIQSDEAANQHRKSQSGQDNAASISASSSSMPAASSNMPSFDDMLFSPLETEGKIFFEGQPVAVIPLYPMYMHPLMDDTIFKIMRSVPALQLVLALPDSFFGHSKDVKHKLSWARQLVRRLWSRGGSLFHRIRLLPSPLSDHRLLQLLRQADVVFDTFPIGLPPHILGLAIGAGTPVITFQPGTSLRTPKDELLESRYFLSAAANQQKYKDHPLRPLVHHQDIPWIPTTSNVYGFYSRVGLDEWLVAKNPNDYFRISLNILSNREFAYEMRVKVLDGLDVDSQQQDGSHKAVAEEDFAKFLYQVGSPWAHDRQTRDEFEAKANHYRQFRNSQQVPAKVTSGGRPTAAQHNSGRNPGSRGGKAGKAEGGFDDFLSGVGSGGVIL